jgi:endonuclease/exonuclease/phosphatase family metal-dependent hydrolase
MKHPHHSTLRVVSYNVRYFGHGTRGLFSTRRAMERIAKGLASLSPLADVVCLQEVESASLRSHFFHVEPEPAPAPQAHRFATKLHAELGGRAGYATYYFPAHAYRLTQKTSFYTTGLVILVRDGLEVLVHNADGPQDVTERAKATARLKQTRIVAHVRVRTKRGETLDVFNTHLSLPRALAADFWTKPQRMGFGKNQLEEAKRVAKFIAKERASDAYVLVGDFNSLPGSPTYRYFTEDCGLCDAYSTHHSLDAQALHGHPTAGFMNLRMRIDHVLAGPGLSFVDFDDTFHFDQDGGRFAGLSDHVPMIGRFTFGDR